MYPLLLVTVAITALGLLLFGGRTERGSGYLLLVVLIAAATLLVFRAPIASLDFEFNPDESQAVAQAMTLVVHPIPWKDYDGNNAGPLDSMVIAWPALLGLSPSYALARFTGLALTAILIAALFATIKPLYGQSAASLGIVLPLTFFATAVDFIQYTTELLPVTLLATAAALAAALWEGKGRYSQATAFASGLLLGAAPLCKIQVTPLALGLLALVAWVLSRRCPTPGSAIALLLAGTFALPGLFVLVAWRNGVLRDAFISYVLQPLAYANGDRIGLDVRAFSLGDSVGFSLFALAELAVFLGALAWIAFTPVRSRPAATSLLPVAIALAIGGLAALVILAPGVHSKHYLLLAVGPLALVAGFALGSRLQTKRDYAVAAAVVVACALPLLVFRVAFTPSRSVLAADHAPKDARVQSTLRAHIEPGDRVAIWGWMPEYFVITKSLLGTRDAISQFQILGIHYRDYYRRRYMDDLERNHPKFFLDAVAPESFVINDRAAHGHETFDRLNAYVNEHYRKVADVQGVRLYELRSGG